VKGGGSPIEDPCSQCAKSLSCGIIVRKLTHTLSMVNRLPQHLDTEFVNSNDATIVGVQRTSRSKTMNVLSMWDRGITSASVRIGDAVVAGVRTFASELIRPTQKSKHLSA
jgi:hypothetical protein